MTFFLLLSLLMPVSNIQTNWHDNVVDVSGLPPEIAYEMVEDYYSGYFSDWKQYDSVVVEVRALAEKAKRQGKITLSVQYDNQRKAFINALRRARRKSRKLSKYKYLWLQ